MELSTLIAIAAIGYGAWHYYMMTQHPDTYIKMREQDRRHRREMVDSIGKHVAPTALSMLAKWLRR